ncbi:MAG: S-layer homology domain-containing protein [Ruminococcaceae bacterium]|nr:S-layer homology domain-containing protein [Oscillospiraceae bacterium]
MSRYLSIKRVVALVMSLVLLSGLLAVTGTVAYAKQDNSYNRVVNFIYAMGIMKEDEDTGVFWGDTPVKRAEIAEILCNMHRINATKNETPMFSDVGDENRAFVETAVRNGFMSGAGNGEFRPKDYVTNEQLVKIFVSVLGGGAMAENMGGYPAGYITMGRKLGLLKNLNGVMTAPAKRIDVANIIYDAMHADMYEMVAISEEDTTYATVDGKTFLKETLDIYSVRGIIEANAVTSLNRPGGQIEGTVKIDGIIYEDKNGLAEDYLGCDVVVYAKEKDGVYTIIYIEEGKNHNQITIEDINITGTDEKEVKYYDENDREQKMTVSAVADMIYNGVAVSFDENRMDVDCGRITLIDNTGDKVADVISITEFKTYVVDRVLRDEEAISMRYNENALSVRDTSCSVYKNGERVTLDDISDGDVILVAVSENETDVKAVRIEASNVAVVGKIENLSSKSGRRYATVSGKKYQVSPYCEKLETAQYIEKMEVGDSGQFYLDSRGVIVNYDANAFSGNVAYLIQSTVKEEGFSSSLAIKLYTSKGEIQILTADSKVRVNDANMKVENIIKSDEIMTKLKTPQLVLYQEKDGVLKEIVFAADGYDANRFSLDKTGTLPCNYSSVIDNKYNVTSDTIVFYVPNTTEASSNYQDIINNTAYYTIYSGSRYVSTMSYRLNMYDIMPDGKVTYIVEKYDPEWATPTSGSQYLAVMGVGEGVDSDGNTVKMIYGINESAKEVSFTTKLSDALMDSSLMREPKQGDIIQYVTDYQGNIRRIKIQHNIDSDVYYTATKTDPNDNNQLKVYGEAVNNNGTKIPIVSKNVWENMTPNDTDMLISNTGTAVLEYDSDRETFNKISFSDILRGDKIFATVNSGNKTRMLVVYK